MKRILIILLILSLLAFNVNAENLNLPVLEHECFTKYVDKNIFYSFTLYQGININTTELDIKDPSVRHVVIQSFSDMCLYTTSPSKCYECITLGNYGLNQTQLDNNEVTPPIDYSNFILKLVLGLVITGLVIFLVYNLKPKKTKHLKPKNK